MATPVRSRRPNILVVVADDHRADCVSGDRISGPATPTLDALMQRGTHINGARIAGGNDPAVCVPSRAALMTGRLPHRALSDPHAKSIAENQRIEGSLTTMAEAFRRAGYESYAVGKWHNDTASFTRGFTGGTRLFFDGMCEHRNPPLHTFDSTGKYDPASAQKVQGFSSEIFAKGAADFLRQRKDSDAPFFLYVAFTSPHDPRTPLPEYRQRYDSASIRLPENFATEHPFDNGELKIRDEMLAETPRSPAEIQKQLADYYALIEHHDHEFGRVLSALDASGESENTIVVYTADHGLAIGSHGLLGKQNLYEHSLKVPMILAGPRIAAHRKLKADLPSYGLFPTLCDLTSVAVPDSVEVESWADRLNSNSVAADSDPEPCFSHYRDVQRAINLGQWKLIHYDVAGTTHRQLFDLEADPAELQNLIEDPDCQKRIAKMSALLETWWTNGPGAQSGTLSEVPLSPRS